MTCGSAKLKEHVPIGPFVKDSMIRLQQIMFFRELGFSLDEVGKMVSRPGFDMLEALKSQRRLLVGRSKRLSDLRHACGEREEELTFQGQGSLTATGSTPHTLLLLPDSG